MKRRIPIALAAALTLGATGCGSGSDAASDSGSTGADGTTTLKVGTIGLASDAGLMTGIEKGYFKDENLNIEVSTIANPAAGVAAAQSGQIDLTYTPSIPLLTAISRGVPLEIVAAADGYEDGSLQAKDLSKIDDTGLYVPASSNITTPADLEGKSIAVPAREAQLEVTVADLVSQDGGDPSTIKWMVLDFASALESLNSGRVDAASLVSPFTSQAVEDGNTLLASPGVEFFKEGAIGLYAAGAETAAAKPEALQGFKEAIHKANAYCNDHLAECQERSAELTGVPLDVIQSGAETYWPTEVRIEDIERVNEKLVDLGYLEEPAAIENVLFQP